MGARRPFWSFIILSVAAVLLLNALAGSSSSPLPRLLHITHVPGWWPLVLALVIGVAFGTVFNTKRTPGGGQQGGVAGGAAGRSPAKPGRGRHAVPRHVRRERERQARRQERAASAAREAEEAARREAEPPRPQGVLNRLRALVGRGSGSRSG